MLCKLFISPILSSASHPLNAYSPMLSSWFMFPSRTSAVHPSNAWLPIFVSPAGNSISCKFVQPEKA